MENLLIINKSNCFKFAELIKYGQNTIMFEDEQVEDIVKKQAETINEMLKLNLFRVENLVENYLENDVWVTHEIPGYFNIICSNRDNRIDIPVLSNDDLNLIGLAEKAQKNKEGVKININERLYPKAKKIAKEKNIKFKIFEEYQYFDGKQKNTSVYSQIEQALLDGKDSISFNKLDVRPQTVRVHACSIGKFNQKKLSVSTDGENVTVWLNNSDKVLKSVRDAFDDLVIEKPNDYKDVWLGILLELHPELNHVINGVNLESSNIREKLLEEIPEEEIWNEVEKEIDERDKKINDDF